jgi:hypothetical protein
MNDKEKIKQAREALKSAEQSVSTQEEQKLKALQELQNLEAEAELQRVLQDLQAQKQVREQEQKAEAAKTPEDYAKEMAILSHLEDIRLAESLLGIAEQELQQAQRLQEQIICNAEMKQKKAGNYLQELKLMVL